MNPVNNNIVPALQQIIPNIQPELAQPGEEQQQPVEQETVSTPMEIEPSLTGSMPSPNCANG